MRFLSYFYTETESDSESESDSEQEQDLNHESDSDSDSDSDSEQRKIIGYETVGQRSIPEALEKYDEKNPDTLETLENAFDHCRLCFLIRDRIKYYLVQDYVDIMSPIYEKLQPSMDSGWGSGLMELVAFGNQDIYNPTQTFVAPVYRRHTNFA